MLWVGTRTGESTQARTDRKTTITTAIAPSRKRTGCRRAASRTRPAGVGVRPGRRTRGSSVVRSLIARITVGSGAGDRSPGTAPRGSALATREGHLRWRAHLGGPVRPHDRFPSTARSAWRWCWSDLAVTTFAKPWGIDGTDKTE